MYLLAILHVYSLFVKIFFLSLLDFLTVQLMSRLVPNAKLLAIEHKPMMGLIFVI